MQIKSIKQYLEFLKHSGIQDIYLNPEKTEKQIEETRSPIIPHIAQVSEKRVEPAIIDPGTKLKELALKYSNCQKCPLAKEKNKFVYGNGNPRAKLMLIDEGPAADEDVTGNVFVGEAGQLLTKMLKAINLERDEVYITNIVKCYPLHNRNPLPNEKRACLPYLEEQIDIVKPQLILFLGREAAVTLLGMDVSMNEFREKTFLYKDIKAYVSYYPSALLKNPGWKKYAWADLQKLQKDYESIK